MDDEECCHLLPPGQCAYCSGSWRREQNELAAETRRIVTAMAKKAARDAGAGTRKRGGWTTPA
jgi:biotin synthase-like enzyme